MASHTSASASIQGFAHSRTCSAASSKRRSRSRAAAARSAPARSDAGRRPQSRNPRSAAATASPASASEALPARATSSEGAPGSVESSPSELPALAPDQHRHREREPSVELAQGAEQRLAHRRPAQLQHRLVREAHGAASSSSIDTPRC